MKALLLIMAGLLSATALHARDAKSVVYHTQAPAALDADTAYLLLDSSAAKSGMMKITHVFMRVPTEAETAAFLAAKREAYNRELPKLKRRSEDGRVPSLEKFQFSWDKAVNAFAVNLGRSFGKSSTYLLAVPPGTYVLYGTAVGTGGLVTCNCLGTVKFTARGGTITRMGTLYADKVHEESPVPHLEDNLGDQMAQYSFVLGQALVPATAEMPMPAPLAHLPQELARYEAVGMFLEPGAQSINRLAPIPGILEYDRGRVLLPND